MTLFDLDVRPYLDDACGYKRHTGPSRTWRGTRPRMAGMPAPPRCARSASRTATCESPTTMAVTPPDLPTLTRRAEALCLLGREDAAALLRPVLTVLDPQTAAPDTRVVCAVLTYLSCRRAAPHPDEAALPWARYAMTAAYTVNGLAHPHTTSAATFLIGLLCADDSEVPDGGRHDELLRAASLIVDARTLTCGADAPQTLIACSYRAGLLHQVGHCRPALTEATDAWMRWWRQHGTTDGQILYTLAAMLLGCGDADQATRWLALHVALAPSPGEAVGRLKQALAVAEHPLADDDHRGVCGAHHAVTHPAARSCGQVRP